MDGTLSAADVLAMTKGGDNFLSGNGILIILFVLLFLFNGGGLFGGGANGALTRAELHDGFNFNQLMNGQQQIERTLCTNNADVLAAIAQNGYNAQMCCCETNRNIDALRYEAQKNTCDITTAIHLEAEATRSLIKEQEIQKLRDDLQSANLLLAQNAQNRYLLESIVPTPRPAYITCSPYQAQMYGCGWGCGC